MGMSDPGMTVDGDVGDVSMFNGERCLKDEPGIDDNSNAWSSITYYFQHRINKWYIIKAFLNIYLW